VVGFDRFAGREGHESVAGDRHVAQPLGGEGFGEL
jgi:hypothetical protein